jgi:hypothetical protein
LSGNLEILYREFMPYLDWRFPVLSDQILIVIRRIAEQFLKIGVDDAAGRDRFAVGVDAGTD